MRADLDRRSELLSDTVDGTLDEAAVLVDLEHDLRFQAELVQYRKLVRGLRSLRHDLLAPEPGVIDEVLLVLDEAGERHIVRRVSGRRVAYISGLAAATAAGVGSAILLSRRRKLAA